MPKIISVVNQKGGVGKSTIAINLARAIQLDGASVAIVDGDPQGTSNDWGAVNKEAGNFYPVHYYNLKDIPDRLKEFANYDVVVVDGAPRLEELAVAIIKISDLIIIPVTPSPNDVWATIPFLELVKSRQNVNPKLKAVFVINRVKPNTTAIKEVVEALGSLQVQILKSKISDRTAYAKSIGNGVTIFEQDKKASGEFTALQLELAEIFD